MSYSGQAALAQDRDFRDRLAACASTLGIQQADRWALDNSWILSASPGFADAYTYAVAVKTPEPGKLESVISDASILAAVHALTR